MNTYLETAIKLCRFTRTEPSFLLHPLDLIGSDQVKVLEFFPGMGVKSKDKVLLFVKIINKLQNNFHLVNMNFYAKKYLEKEKIKQKNLFKD